VINHVTQQGNVPIVPLTGTTIDAQKVHTFYGLIVLKR